MNLDTITLDPPMERLLRANTAYSDWDLENKGDEVLKFQFFTLPHSKRHYHSCGVDCSNILGKLHCGIALNLSLIYHLSHLDLAA